MGEPNGKSGPGENRVIFPSGPGWFPNPIGRPKRRVGGFSNWARALLGGPFYFGWGSPGTPYKGTRKKKKFKRGAGGFPSREGAPNWPPGAQPGKDGSKRGKNKGAGIGLRKFQRPRRGIPSEKGFPERPVVALTPGGTGKRGKWAPGGPSGGRDLGKNPPGKWGAPLNPNRGPGGGGGEEKLSSGVGGPRGGREKIWGGKEAGGNSQII